MNEKTKKFKGLQLATNVAAQALMKTAKVEKEQIRLEFEHLENIK